MFLPNGLGYDGFVDDRASLGRQYHRRGACRVCSRAADTVIGLCLDWLLFELFGLKTHREISVSEILVTC